jgi:hypothetical protein
VCSPGALGEGRPARVPKPEATLSYRLDSIETMIATLSRFFVLLPFFFSDFRHLFTGAA